VCVRVQPLRYWNILFPSVLAHGTFDFQQMLLGLCVCVRVCACYLCVRVCVWFACVCACVHVCFFVCVYVSECDLHYCFRPYSQYGTFDFKQMLLSLCMCVYVCVWFARVCVCFCVCVCLCLYECGWFMRACTLCVCMHIYA